MDVLWVVRAWEASAAGTIGKRMVRDVHTVCPTAIIEAIGTFVD